MNYKFLLILTLTFSLLNADAFTDINPVPNPKMLENQKKSKSCAMPIVADEEISENFKYGCFCGKNYPNIGNNETKDFRELNKKERIKLIESYFLIKPYDEIDAVCQQHDICYLYQGKKAKVCNDAIYDEMAILADKFQLNEATDKNKQCKYLASDIASVFKTIFASSDDKNSIFQIGALLFNTSLTVAQKTFEESIDTIIEQGERYPPKNEKCLISQR